MDGCGALGRGYVDRLRGRLGALRCRIETADAFDLVAKEVDPVGAVSVVGVDVDQAAPCGDLPRLLAKRFRVVIEIGGEAFD